ncbi:hypothetical protein [Streptomyces beihaiensis]|uniref:Uncharacterized protein n=1 Tax=Streptomyces beihaiensis TaxID=2984495 RepID=A0ABT3TV57_9ACTN|nr:hypothetical protein [Streptomyces beihaiensis]MCX3060932.1 hypothetical protein [Streptomyces beihaiensis]
MTHDEFDAVIERARARTARTTLKPVRDDTDDVWAMTPSGYYLDEVEGSAPLTPYAFRPGR